MIQRKHEYESYTRALKKKLQEGSISNETEAVLSDQTESNIEEFPEFLMLNREPHYLKQSMLDYVSDQKLDHVLRNIDLTSWSDDMHARITVAHPKGESVAKKASPPKKKMPAKKSSSSTQNKLSQGPRDMYLSWPIDKTRFWLSSPFGPRKKPDGSWGYHHGIDMAALKGTPVQSAADGIVIEVQRSSTGYGNTIVIQTNKKYKMRYAHLDTILVSNGQKVGRGQLIGKVGDTGLVRKKGKDASHLHFELYAFGKQINPLYFFA